MASTPRDTPQPDALPLPCHLGAPERAGRSVSPLPLPISRRPGGVREGLRAGGDAGRSRGLRCPKHSPSEERPGPAGPPSRAAPAPTGAPSPRGAPQVLVVAARGLRGPAGGYRARSAPSRDPVPRAPSPPGTPARPRSPTTPLAPPAPETTRGQRCGRGPPTRGPRSGSGAPPAAGAATRGRRSPGGVAAAPHARSTSPSAPPGPAGPRPHLLAQAQLLGLDVPLQHQVHELVRRLGLHHSRALPPHQLDRPGHVDVAVQTWARARSGPGAGGGASAAGGPGPGRGTGRGQERGAGPETRGGAGARRETGSLGRGRG